MSAPAIDIKKLSKRYGRSDKYALKDLTLEVMPGEVYGFLGPNGAGKSTTIRTLLNFLQPASGGATVLGKDIVKDSLSIRAEVGYLSGEFSLYRKMSGHNFLEYMAELQPLKHDIYQKDLVARFDAPLDKTLETLSKGNKQKIGLIQAFMHEPRVLILDEPTSGLDPLMQEEFFKLIREVQAKGTAVFVSSHNLAEAFRMCDRVGFIRDGLLVGEETIADLQNKAAHAFIITFTQPAPLKELKALNNAIVTARNDTIVRVQLEGELSPLFNVVAKHKVSRFDPEEASLEQEFLRFYKGPS